MRLTGARGVERGRESMRSGILVVAVAAAMWLCACGGVRESRPLQYPGNSLSAAEALGAAISKRGFVPSCKPREYCKFKYAEPVTLHFKIKPGRVTLAVDVDGGEDMAPADLQKLVGQMMALGEEIWNEARPMALAQEEELRKAEELRRAEAERQAAIARAEWERRAAEAARVEAERQAAEAARLEAERQAAARVVYPEVTYVAAKGAAFHFVLPEQSVCQVEGDTSWTGPRQIEIPFQIRAIRDVYYTFDCQLPLGVVWHQKLQAKDGFVATVRLYQGAPPPSTVPDPVIGPPVPPGTRPHGHPHHHPGSGPAASQAMSAQAFASLTASVEKESFSADKLRVVQLAAAGSWFTSSQVAALVDLMTFSGDKIKVIELTRARIVDKGNAHVIVGRLTFSGDKEKATKLLTE